MEIEEQENIDSNDATDNEQLNNNQSEDEEQYQEEKQENVVQEIQENTNKINQNSQFPQKEETVHKCFNNLCPSQKVDQNVRLIKSENNYFCESCHKRFKDDHYCRYCKQIYYAEEDGNYWIECDECKKWTHADCQQSKGEIKNIKQLISTKLEFPFKCPKCRAQIKFKPFTTSVRDKAKPKKNDYILNNYGFYWKLKPQQINADYEKIKNMLHH